MSCIYMHVCIHRDTFSLYPARSQILTEVLPVGHCGCFANETIVPENNIAKKEHGVVPGFILTWNRCIHNTHASRWPHQIVERNHWEFEGSQSSGHATSLHGVSSECTAWWLLHEQLMIRCYSTTCTRSLVPGPVMIHLKCDQQRALKGWPISGDLTCVLAHQASMSRLDDTPGTLEGTQPLPAALAQTTVLGTSRPARRWACLLWWSPRGATTSQNGNSCFSGKNWEVFKPSNGCGSVHSVPQTVPLV